MQKNDSERVHAIREERQTRNLITSALYAFIFVGVAALIAAITYVSNFGRSLSNDRDDWGVFGDFLGGVLNPIVGIATIYLVLTNLIVQRKELKKSTEALALQNVAIEEQSFQNVFFNWVNAYNNQVSDFEWTPPVGGPPYRGHAAISKIYRHHLVSESVVRKLAVLPPNEFNTLLDKSAIADEQLGAIAEHTILDNWNAFKLSREDYFEGAFRTLVGILNWIDGEPNNRIREQKKAECFAIVESQLSNAEKVFLLYESWSMTDDEIWMLKAFNILSTLEKSSDPIAKFMLRQARHLN